MIILMYYVIACLPQFSPCAHDLDVCELFAGDAQFSQAALERGLTTRSMDLSYGASFDLDSAAGYLIPDYIHV